MVVNHLSVNTIKGYMAAIKRLHAFYSLAPEQISEDQLIAFICHIKEGLNLSSVSMRIAVCAIKYFYRHILGMTALAEKIPYPKQEKKIRTILTGAETKALFEKTTNIKHRLLLKLTYSSGLRRGEVISIQLADFDWKNMHSFASHLLAIHTDVVTVQKLMGHDDIRTTMQYFHLGNRPNSAPRSPMDTIYPKS